MKRLILYFLLILGSIWVGLKIFHQPGYVLVLYQQWAVETTTWFLILALLLAFFLFHILISLLKGTIRLPSRIEQWWQRRKQYKTMKWLNKGFYELSKGKWKKAEKHLMKSSKNKSLSFMSYAVAAQAAEAQNAFLKRDQYLILAKRTAGKDGYVADLMRAQFLLKDKKTEEALTLLLSLKEEFPKDPYLLRLLSEAYLQLHDWTHLQAMLSDLKKHKVFDQPDYLALEKKSYLHLLQDHFFTEFSQVQILWNKLPKNLRHDPEILIAYAKHLNRWNRSHEAEELIRSELKKHFSSALMEFYVTTSSKDPVKQLALGEKYLKHDGGNPGALKAMGMLCLRNRLWGQARDYLEKSLKMQASPETYSALGYAFEKLGENEKALSNYRKGLSYLTSL